MGHAFLLHGPAGIGKKRLAFALARMLLCPDRGGCGHCPTCLRVDRQTHADFHVVEREKQTRGLKIEQIRELQEQISLRPMEGQNKVCILADCQSLGEEAANALLKTLEEPPPRTFFFLLTEICDALPDTIRSRCQEIRVPAWTTRDVAAALRRSAPDLPQDRADFLARLAEGSLGRAEEMHRSEVLQQAAWLLGKLETLTPANELQLAGEIHASVRQTQGNLEAQRDEFRRCLSLLNTFWRDMIYRSLGLPPDRWFHTDARSLQFYETRGLTLSQAIAAIELSFQAEAWVLANANVHLVIENYVVGLCRLWHGRPDGEGPRVSPSSAG
jgi:DNA polymerase-3 subunit delta'